MFSYDKNMANFEGLILLGYFIKHKPPISDECTIVQSMQFSQKRQFLSNISVGFFTFWEFVYIAIIRIYIRDFKNEVLLIVFLIFNVS